MKFSIEENIITEECSGMQLQLINEEVANSDGSLPWISGWFKQRDGRLLIQYFKVMPVGTPSYRAAGKMVDFWGEQLLGIEQASSNEMSGSFGLAFLIPAVKKAYLKMDYQVGQKYDVPCAEILWKEDNRIYYVPVFDHLHVDPQFGFEHLHYHIDGRFELHPRMKHRLNVTNGHTLSVIVTHDDAIYKFQRVVLQQLKCERGETGLSFASTVDETRLENLKRYEDWYAGFVGKSCEGKRCPHYGTEMLERDGKLVCPMHGLTADRATLRIIPSPRV